MSSAATGAAYVPLRNHGGEDHDPVAQGLERGRVDLPVDDLDQLFSQLYKYWERHGLWGSILYELTAVLMFAFVVGFSTFLYFVDWSEVWHDNPQIGLSAERLANPSKVLLFFVGGFSIGVVVHFVVVLSRIRAVLRIHAFFTNVLPLQSGDDVRCMRWGEVVDRVVTMSNDPGPRGRRLTRDTDLNHKNVVQRIMRKENYFIALVNERKVDISLPIIGTRMLTKTLEWNLSLMLDFLFVGNGSLYDLVRMRWLCRQSAEHDVDPSFLNERKHEQLTRSLRRYVIFLGLANLVLAPFVLVYLLAYLVFRYGQELHENPGALLGARGWSPLAFWKMRLYNEVPALFRARMQAAYKPAEKYCSLFPARVLNIAIQFVAFVVGAMSVVLLAIGLISDEVMTKADILGKNFLWFLTVFGAILAVCRALTSEPDTALDPTTALKAVRLHTSFYPRHWRNRENTFEVYSEFTGMFQFRPVLLLLELSSVLLAPFILLFSVAPSCERVVRFVKEYTVRVTDVGHVCCFGNFDLRECGNSSYSTGSTDPRKPSKPSFDGKMEFSVLNFMGHYPNWFSTDAVEYIDRLRRLAAGDQPVGGHAARAMADYERSVVLAAHRTHAGARTTDSSEPAGFATQHSMQEYYTAPAMPAHATFSRLLFARVDTEQHMHTDGAAAAGSPQGSEAELTEVCVDHGR